MASALVRWLKWWGVLALLLVPGAALHGQTVTSGSEVRASGPEKIVSLAPHLTELLFELKLGPEIAGVTDYCNFPAEARSKPRIGALMTLQVERLLALNPDLIVYSAAQPGDIARLRAGNIRTVHLPTETISDVTSAVMELGRLTGRTTESQELVHRLETELEQVRQRAAQRLSAGGGRAPRVLLVLSRRPDSVARSVLSAGPNTFLDDLITVAGGENVARRAGVRYPTLSTESLLTLDRPDVIIELRQGDGGEDAVVRRDRAAADGEARRAWEGLYGAGQMPRLEMVDTGDLLVPGSRLGKSAQRLAGVIWPGTP